MKSAEHNLYLNFTKSVVNSFEDFVSCVDKHGEVLSDEELIQDLRRIGKKLKEFHNSLKIREKFISITFSGKKLQTVFNKWENKERVRNSIKLETHTEEKSAETNSIKLETYDKEKSAKTHSNEKPIEEVDEFELIISNRIVDPNFTKRDAVLSTEVSSTSVKDESFDAESTAKLTRKEVELIRKFKIENVKEQWIRNNEGFYVEEYTPGSWKCSPCKLDNLSIANIISHLSGTKHQKKIDLKKREVSETRKSEYNYDSDLSSTLTDVEPELLKKQNGADIIIPFRGFYCNACSSTINSEESLKLHINGGKHRKNCESS